MYSKSTSNQNLLTNNNLLEKYIKDIGNNEKEALENLYEITKIAVYGFILSIMKNKSDAEDILQDVYLKIYENASFYQPKGKPLAWILTIAKNLCYMKFRKKDNSINIDDIHGILDDEKCNLNIEDKLVLESAFKYISDEERNIIILHLVSGLKHREIAKILELPLSTVLSKYHRALKKLKNILKEDIK